MTPENMEAALQIGRRAEKIMNKKLAEFSQRDWFALQEMVGTARLFRRGARINITMIAAEIGLKRAALSARRKVTGKQKSHKASPRV